MVERGCGTLHHKTTTRWDCLIRRLFGIVSYRTVSYWQYHQVYLCSSERAES